jgi:hypothetical protein
VRPKLGKLDALADAPVIIENGLSQAVEAEMTLRKRGVQCVTACSPISMPM